MSLLHFSSRPCFSISASLQSGVERGTMVRSWVAPNHREGLEERKEKLKKVIQKTELSISAYDTAWVAMVPAQDSPQTPSFPQCVNWVLDNQCSDGSWRLPHQSSDLLKDVLQSTLACVIALKKWRIGDEQISKGVQFIESNISLAIAENFLSPIGFDVIFPGMIQYAGNLSLSLCIPQEILNGLFLKRDVELKSLLEEKKAYMAYVSEGMVDIQDGETLMKYQKKNGSLFNSPSTTAAALTWFQNSGCHNYLNSTLTKFGNAVPTFYPFDRYAKLFMIDNLEKLGIARYFTEEINNAMDETYRSWLQEEEEIVEDASTCALAFRLLRKNGYDVSADPLVKYMEEDSPANLNYGQLKDMNSMLELYRASEMVIHPDEGILEKFNSRTKQTLEQFLRNECVDANGLSLQIRKQVADALKFPFRADLHWVRSRRNIEHCGLNDPRVLKTSYRLLNTGNKDFLNLAVEDFNLGLRVHHDEFADLERWVADNKLDKLKFARQKSAYGYFSAAVTLTSPELSDARMSWAKNCVLTTVIDDFFDVGGTIKEMKNLIELIERWDVSTTSSDCCSEQVEIIFSALKSTICELGDKTLAWQSRDETHHIIQIWLDLLKAFLREAEWTESMSVPTLDEYMANAKVSFALGPIILPALYFIGPKLPKDAVKHSDVQNLYRLVSTCGRLLNDTQGFEVESSQGKLNAVPLHIIHGIGGQTQEAVIGELRHQINTRRRELLRLVLQQNDSVLPRECRDLFWNMSQILHLFYAKEDGFSSKEMMKSVGTILFEPLPPNLTE